MSLDTIIIGSGVGGLSAAICLARRGQKVLIIEQHVVPGGWCHSFYRDGHRFSPGMHYIGQLGKSQSTNELYRGLGIANDLVFFEMNPEAYEHCWVGQDRIDIPANFNALFKILSERFPAERSGLEKYLEAVRNVSRQLALISEMKSFWDHLTIAWRTRHLGKFGMFSLKTVIDWHIKDPLLKQVLTIQCGNHGLPPGKASFPYHAAVMDHYSNGGFYPLGGGAAIVKAMTGVIKRHGGEIRTGQKVKRILTEGTEQKRAFGIELEGGEQILANRVISNADPDRTYLDLVGKENLSVKLLKQLKKAKYSSTTLILFLTVDMDLREAGLDSGNIWLRPAGNPDTLYQQCPAGGISPTIEFSGLFISSSTLKDPTSYDGKHHTLEVVTFIDPTLFQKFLKEGNVHSQAYRDLKEMLEEQIIQSLERVLPGISRKILQKELGTPLTNAHYINASNGCAYGTEKSFWQIGAFGFKPVSEIKDLYLCGASILANGIAGASYSGVQTAAKILGCSQADLLIPEETQQLRIYNAEDDSLYPEWIKNRIKEKRRVKIKN